MYKRESPVAVSCVLSENLNYVGAGAAPAFSLRVGLVPSYAAQACVHVRNVQARVISVNALGMSPRSLTRELFAKAFASMGLHERRWTIIGNVGGNKYPGHRSARTNTERLADLVEKCNRLLEIFDRNILRTLVGCPLGKRMAKTFFIQNILHTEREFKHSPSAQHCRPHHSSLPRGWCRSQIVSRPCRRRAGSPPSARHNRSINQTLTRSINH